MRIDVQFEELNSRIAAEFGEVQTASDGGYERGYAKGYEVGNVEGYAKGHAEGKAEGLAERKYETWEITLADGTVIEKDVALV